MAAGPRLKSPVIRLGGKTRLLPTLLTVLEQMAPHTCYVEPFCGGAVLLFAKRPSEVEIINDLDRAIYDFFCCMRNEGEASRLQRLLTYTPWSRAELIACAQSWRDVTDRVERVRQWFAVSRMSFTHELEDPSWWAAKAENQALRFASTVDMLDIVAQRLRRVQIDNRSYEHVIKLYDSPQTLFYLDPPYVQSARVAGKYEHELTDEQHAHLLDLVVSCKGQVILSGYHSPLYDERLAHLPLVEKTRECTIRNSRTQNKSYRTECLWIKAHPFGLFSMLQATPVDEQTAVFARGLGLAASVNDGGVEGSVYEGESLPLEAVLSPADPQVKLHNFSVSWEDVARRFS